MAGIVKRVAAVLVSVVWLSLVLVLLAGFFVPNLHALLPAPVKEITDPEALRERWGSFTDSLMGGIGGQPPAGPEATATTTPDPALSTSPTATPVPETPTAAPPTPEPATPTTAPSMSSDGDDQPPAAETSVSVSVSEDRQADLRSAPSEDADVIGLVASGGTIIVNGRDSTGRWYRLEDGTWIDADDLVDAPQELVPVVMVETEQPLEGPEDPSPPSEVDTASPSTQLAPVTAVVNADSNLRAGPGTEYDRVDGVNFGEEVSVVGISADGTWYLLESGAWLFAALLVEAVDVPVVTEDTDPDELTTADTEQIDTGDEQAAAGTEQPDTETEQTDPDDEQTETETEQPETETEQPDAETEQTDTDDEQTETEADTEQLQPVVIAPLGANLRAGPGVEFDRVDGVEQGEVLTIVAQDEGGDWLKLEDGSWIFADLVDNVPADLPVDSGEAMEAETDESGADDETPDETTPPDASDDEQDVQAGDDEQDAQTDEDEQEAQTDEDEQDAQADEDEQDTQTDEDAQDAQTDEDEEDTQEEADQVVLATVNTDANLRNGPGLDATIVDSAPVGTQVTIVARFDDDQWLQLDNGNWIFAALVDILPAEDDEDADTGTDDNDDGQSAHPQVIALDLIV